MVKVETNGVEIKNFKKVVIIYNPNSGKQIFVSMLSRVLDLKRRLTAIIGPNRVELTELREFKKLTDWADKIKEEKYDWVIVAGGDGTLRAMIAELDRNGYVPYISVFPAGTVNLVAKEFDMPADPVRWIQRVRKGRIKPVRIGKANGHIFLTVAGIGFDSKVVDSVSSLEKRFLSSFAYVVQSGELVRKELLLSNWRYRFRVKFDGDPEWYEASSVIIGKSRYYAGRYSLFKGAAITNDYFDVALFTGCKRADFLKYAAMILMESLEGEQGVIVKKAHTLTIECNVDGFPAELDGDVVTATPLLIEMYSQTVNFSGVRRGEDEKTLLAACVYGYCLCGRIFFVVEILQKHSAFPGNGVLVYRSKQLFARCAAFGRGRAFVSAPHAYPRQGEALFSGSCNRRFVPWRNGFYGASAAAGRRRCNGTGNTCRA